jgi:isopentenyl diphosphate isomerase/L-lactate dehydrogenase-like FMN-dependent dehydrogenase
LEYLIEFSTTQYGLTYQPTYPFDTRLKDHEKTKSLVQRAEKAGYAAIVLTVDLPVLGNRTSLKRIGFSVPKEFKVGGWVCGWFG